MTQRVETRPPQCLVGIDVADPGKEGLVEQERLEPGTPGTQPPPEGRHGEVPAERLRAMLVGVV